MRKVLIEVYSLRELPLDIQTKVIDKFRYANTEDYNWSDFIIQHWQEKLATLGYEDAKILFSGFSSQGDGACFTAKINIEMWLKERAIEWKNRALVNAYREDKITANLKHQGRYYHEHSTTLEIDAYDASDSAHAQMNTLEKVLKDDAVSLSKQIYKELEKEYDFQTSKEQVVETIDANEYEFTKDGKVFHE